MVFMCSAKRLYKLSIPFLVLLALFSVGIQAQTKKKTATKTPAKKTATAKKSTNKTASKSSSKASSKTTAKKSTDKKKAADTKKSTKNSKTKETAKKTPKKQTAAQRRAEIAKKKKEEERRQAALEAQRRREQAAREARARKLAFERGLQTETVANILADKTEGEDLAVRRVAVDALGSRAGTVVVMEAKTGRIVTVVNQDWAVHDGFKPCSTIKLVTGVAGLNENLINGDGNIIGDSMRMELNDALAYSNNAYFQRVGVKMGTDKMIEYAKMLGLGQKTGINVPGETPGRLPYGNSNPRIYSHADDFEVTPLQLAVLVSALTNGGNRVVPFFARTRVENAAFKPKYSGSIGLSVNKYKGVVPGMMGAAEYGTARRGVDASMGIAGKTGSCIGKGTWVGLFASVAPVNDPKYAVVVITRGQNERGKYAAAVAGKIYEELRPRMERPTRTIIDSDVAANPLKKTEILTAVIEDGEEEDDETLLDTADVAETVDPAADGGRRRIVVGSAQETVSPNPPKKVIKTTQSRPAFKPVVITVKKRPEEKSRPRVVKNK